MDRSRTVNLYYYEEFGTTIVIENWGFALGGGSILYEFKDGYWIRYIAEIPGDDDVGHGPLYDPKATAFVDYFWYCVELEGIS